MNYRWILFDADDTLFEFNAYVGLERMLARFGMSLNAAEYAIYQQCNKPLWVDYQAGRISAEYLQTTRFAHWASQLGIITNGFTALQKARLAHNGFEDSFSTLVISEEIGVAKPAVAIFEHALELMGHPPKEQVLMVGDNPHSDIAGGINAGVRTCWLNRFNALPIEGIEPDHEVNSLPELQQLLCA